MMMASSVIRSAFVLSLLVVLIAAKPTDKHGKQRGVKEEKLSEQDHYLDEEHNNEYDHEAFLGQDAAQFDELDPEESKRRLGIIYDKIDTDGDGKVTEDELKAWIKYTQGQYISSHVDETWKRYNLAVGGKLEWEPYLQDTYGVSPEEDIEEIEGFEYKELIRRDEVRWATADVDDDKSLNNEEFTNFLHPEEADHMKGIVVEETLADIDKDKDGFVSLEEYIGDLYQGDDENAPDWVKTERDHFSQFRDKNGDGKMDKREVQEWILPQDYDHAEAESKHLIYESDADKDKMLTKEEVLAKYDLFVGSQATDFGEALIRHDEF
ncbi:calumenin-A-like isoform X1 [Glandiceps talaboti]